MQSQELVARRDTVLVLMQNRNNGALLASTLGPEHTVILDGMETEDFDGDAIDMVIVDGYSLHRYSSEIAQLRSAQEPLYLPVLLLSDRDAGEIRSARFAGIVDDVVARPLSRAELAMRMNSMMRARSLSKQMVDLEEHHANERRIAQRFQEAALPRDLPELDHLQFSAFYSAGQSVSTIGGDWYDALVLEDGRVVVTIGDVLGSGLEAAVVMAHIRQVARGVAHIHPDPRMMLDAANRNLNAEGKGRIVTAFVGVIDLVACNLTFANAGHPAPLMRTSDGTVVELPDADLPLGIGTQAPQVRHAPFTPGTSLVLYTDGLVESERDVLRGRMQLLHAVTEGHVLNDAEPAAALFHRVVHGNAPDDVAILIIQRNDVEYAGIRRTFDSNDEAAFRELQGEICCRLKKHGYLDSDCAIAELILTELVGNVVRYAPGCVEVVLEENGKYPVLHVLDRGPSFSYAPRLPANLLSEQGRGLFMVRELAREFNVSERTGGGSHARAVFLNTG